MEVLADDKVLIIFQYLSISNQRVAPLIVICQSYLSDTEKKKANGRVTVST